MKEKKSYKYINISARGVLWYNEAGESGLMIKYLCVSYSAGIV